jgi:flavodoxin
VNSLVVYYSLYGNTRRLTEAIAETLRSAGPVLVTGLDRLNPADLVGIDLLVMGSPTHMQNVPKAVRAALANLPRKSLSAKRVAAFDTSRQTWGPLMRMTAAHGLLRRLRKLGGKPALGPQTFLVKATATRPEGETDLLCQGELERAADWATAILERLQAPSAAKDSG